MIIAGSGSSSENTVGGLADPKTPEILVTNLDDSGSVGDFTSPPSVSRSRGSTVHTNIQWKENLRDNFDVLIVQKCAEATKAAIADNVDIEVSNGLLISSSIIDFLSLQEC